MRCAVGVVAPLLLVLTACSGGSPGGTSATGPAATGHGTVTVLAASSLAAVVEQVARDAQGHDPGLRVTVVPGGSSDLVTQLANGLPGDVLVTADERTMTSAEQQGLVRSPVRVATNTLELAVAPGNPLHLASLADAAAHDLVVCAPQVPCGAAARRLASATGTTLHPRSEEPNVTAVLEKVESGQADAGVVYRTDVRRAGARVTGIRLAGADAVVTRQMVAATANASAAGRELAALLAGPTGRAALTAAGFGAP